MNIVRIRMTFAVALVLVLTATGLWAGGAEEGSAAAADKKYVTDPTNGKVVTAPEYGGTFTQVQSNIAKNIDPYFSYTATNTISGVNEKLGYWDWALDRDVFDFLTGFVPLSALTGRLAESWDISPDGLTYTFNIRQDVHWHNKPPVNGRELTAEDIEYSFQRILGLGEFSEAEPSFDVAAAAHPLEKMNVESITATDKWTVVFKLKSIRLEALKEILLGSLGWIMAREVVEQYGDVTDWRNVVGTGPFELTDHVEGSSLTYTKNPDYWGYDEKYPENRLPYVDEIRSLISTEQATNLALMRTGKADYIGRAGGTIIRSIDTAVSLQRTNPELNLWPFSFRANTAMTFNVQMPPWNDVTVRRAIQMAVDFETINDTYFHGWADTTPAGQIGTGLIGYFTPFEDWPEELKGYYTYDPEGAEALLDEAGLPRGADGVRFRTVYDHYKPFDFDYYQIVIEYLRAIGIAVEVQVLDGTAYTALVREHKQQGLVTQVSNADYQPALLPLTGAYSASGWNPPNVNDTVYDAMYEAAEAATTIEEQKRLVNEANMYLIENHWWFAGPRVPSFNVSQPWIIGYDGENDPTGDSIPLFARLWIDSELKEAMGH